MARSTLRLIGVEVVAAILVAVALLAALPASTIRDPEGGFGAPGGTATPGVTASSSASPTATPSPTPSASAPPSGEPGIPSGDSTTGQTHGTARSVLPVFGHGPRTGRVIALTFDDGYSPSATTRILAILRAEHVAATFFPYGAAVRSHPEVWRAVAAAGYPIGNHTQSHPDLAPLSFAAVRSQLDRARATIEQAIGVPMIPVVRPPYGSWNARTASAAHASGYLALVLWDVDTRDWTGVPASVIASRAEAGRSGSIVLMHAGPAQTPLALPAIIRWYKAHGYSFVTVPELLATSLPGLQQSPVPSTPGRPRTSATPPDAAAPESPAPTTPPSPSPSLPAPFGGMSPRGRATAS